MKRTFHIPSKNPVESAAAVLLCELSQHHVCLSLANARTKQVQQLSYYELNNCLAPETLKDILQAEALVPSQMRRVVISNANRELVLIPSDYFSEENARLFYTNTFGNTAGAFSYDAISHLNAFLVHALPQAIMDILKSSYDTELAHLFCYGLNAHHTMTDNISLHFTSTEIYITAAKDDQLKLAQSYRYAAPLDAVYYVLALCEQFQFSQTKTQVLLSGLITADSAMYTELSQFFSNLHFWKPATRQVLPGEDPQHYFASIYNLATCVL